MIKINKVKIITDSCSDLTGELLERYDIDYAQMNTIRDGKETKASLLWEYYTPQELYNAIRNGERIFLMAALFAVLPSCKAISKNIPTMKYTALIQRMQVSARECSLYALRSLPRRE